MDAEVIKSIVKDHLVRKGCSVELADDLLAGYAEMIYEDFDNGESCEEIAQSIIDNEEFRS